MKFKSPEHSFRHEPSKGPQIETRKTPEGNEVSFSPDRGGIITSIKFNGKEVLFLDEESFKDVDANVKGGIPILFPNAGPIEGPKYPNLKQHGFARNEKFVETDKNKDTGGFFSEGFVEVLESNKNTKEVFPYDFSLLIRAEFEEDGSFKITQSVKNKEKEKDLPISMGLHPYFRVPNEVGEDAYELKKKIKFNFKGGEAVEKRIDEWANGNYISIDNPGKPMEIKIPGLGKLSIEASKEYQKIWIWSKLGQDFICVEPVMRDPGGLIDNPEKIKPGEIFAGTTRISLKEN